MTQYRSYLLLYYRSQHGCCKPTQRALLKELEIVPEELLSCFVWGIKKKFHQRDAYLPEISQILVTARDCVDLYMVKGTN